MALGCSLLALSVLACVHGRANVCFHSNGQEQYLANIMLELLTSVPLIYAMLILVHCQARSPWIAINLSQCTSFFWTTLGEKFWEVYHASMKIELL
jgi:hypothetical protein